MIKFIVVLTCVAVIASHAEAAVTCSGILNTLAPCIGYLRAAAPGPIPAACCAGAKSLYLQRRSTPDRQAACRCLKPILQTFPVSPNAIASIAPKCGIALPFKITPNINCSRVH